MFEFQRQLLIVCHGISQVAAFIAIRELGIDSSDGSENAAIQ